MTGGRLALADAIKGMMATDMPFYIFVSCILISILIVKFISILISEKLDIDISDSLSFNTSLFLLAVLGYYGLLILCLYLNGIYTDDPYMDAWKHFLDALPVAKELFIMLIITIANFFIGAWADEKHDSNDIDDTLVKAIKVIAALIPVVIIAISIANDHFLYNLVVDTLGIYDTQVFAATWIDMAIFYAFFGAVSMLCLVQCANISTCLKSIPLNLMLAFITFPLLSIESIYFTYYLYEEFSNILGLAISIAITAFALFNPVTRKLCDGIMFIDIAIKEDPITALAVMSILSDRKDD